MKTILVLATFLTLFSESFAQNENINAITQNVIGKKWRTNFVIGAENYQATLMQTTIELSDTGESPFGDFIEIKKDGSFVSFNQGPCGNECRVRVYGKCNQLQDDKVEFFIERIEYHKMCIETPTKIVNKSLGIYSFVSNKEGFSLTRENVD